MVVYKLWRQQLHNLFAWLIVSQVTMANDIRKINSNFYFYPIRDIEVVHTQSILIGSKRIKENCLTWIRPMKFYICVVFIFVCVVYVCDILFLL